MNAYGTFNQSNKSSPFKIPLAPTRKGKKIKNRLEINHHKYNAAIKYKILKDLSAIQMPNKQKSNHSTPSKSLNKRKIFKCPHFTSPNLVVTPAVSMIYKISKRSRDVERHEEVYSLPKRRKLDIKSAKTFKVEDYDSYIRADDNCQLSCQDIFRLFDVDKVEKKLPDQNENLLAPSETLKDYKPLVIPESGWTNNNQNLIELNSQSSAPPPWASDDNLILEIAEQNVDIKDNKLNVFDREISSTITKSESPNVSQSNDIQICNGQLLWTRYSKYPYWPSIVCPADNGIIQDTNQLVHVRFCANKRSSGWIKIQNIFEFKGIEAYKEKKESMQSKLKKNEFKNLFPSYKQKYWLKAVVEATFLMCKNLEDRLVFFDIIAFLPLRETSKKLLSLPELIRKNCSNQEFMALDKILKENPNACVDIQHELDCLTSTVHLSCENSPVKTRSPSTNESNEKDDRKSAPALVNRRMSVRLVTVYRNQSFNSASNMRASSKDKTVTEEQTILTDQEKSSKSKRISKKKAEFETDMRSYIMKSHSKKVLFEGIRRGNVCKICFSQQGKVDADLTKCAGTCGDYVHEMCVSPALSKNNEIIVKMANTRGRKSGTVHKNTTNILLCNDCVDLSSPVCYACKNVCSTQKEFIRCSVKSCGRYFHIKCLGDWLQTKFVEGKTLCPSHVCHTCVSDDPRNKHYDPVNSKLTRCVKCPTTYHIDSCCIPAGVKILTQTQHICIRHRTEFRKPVNLNWCYICGKSGGMLLCCESCPQTCHMSCLELSTAPEHYFCDSCETGRHPLYGEIVWAKFAQHRWWPAIVVPPFCIPDSTVDVSHHEHDLCVRFFGSYDFAWIGRTFVYLYDKGDASSSFTGDLKHDAALLEAENWFNKLQQNEYQNNGKYFDSKKDKLLPKPYVKINTIKPLAPARLIKGESEAQRCNCSPDDVDPCGPASSCVNRACLTECDELCPCGLKCNNQCIDRKIYASFKLTYMGDKGFGLLAEESICTGTLVIEYIGELVTENEFQLRLSTKQTHNFYFMKYMKGLYIDAELKGNMSRFMNHSCNPNCEPQVWSVNGVNRIGLFAISDISKGTELTFNYEFDDNTHKCYCGEKNCKGFIGRKIA